MDSPCTKFGDCASSCFGFIVRTDRQTDRQTESHTDAVVGVSNKGNV